MVSTPSGSTWHLVPAAVWEEQRTQALYRPEAFAADGFVHCTDGLDQLLVPANTYYRDDPRPYLALEIDLDAIAAPARYDDEAERYPHVYGPIDVAAVRTIFAAERAGDGTFTGFTPV
ncbi:MAG: DUF952 domain-containing protein [Acidimicrobiia bacterium]|nr:DUF952 domain-containing protein [Acidimicrobiia bacterium]